MKIINSVSLITGALSFSAALAWNKAISDSITRISGQGIKSSIIQAIITTLVVIIIVLIINASISIYTKYNKIPLKSSVLNIGSNRFNKVNLW